MRNLLLASAAMALITGVAFGQMQGSPSGQNMNQQMQNMERENPHAVQHKPGNQATPQGAPSGGEEMKGTATGGQEQMQQSTTVHEQGSVKGVRLTPTKTLPSDQKVRIRQTVIESGSAPRVENVNFTLRVGAPIPRSVRVVPVPQEIIALYPEWSGFLYFVSGDEIIVVDPNSYAVVGVLEA